MLKNARLAFSRIATAPDAFARPESRLVAVDFWRGLALLMIFVDHVPAGFFCAFTPHNWGFSDAAEIFVFLAGFNAVLSFSPSFLGQGFVCGMLKVARRTWQLFCAHILLVFAGAALFAAAQPYADVTLVMHRLNFTPFFTETGVALARLFRLAYLPNLMDILPIYIVFIGFFPLLWLLLRLSPWLALAASGGLWLWARLAHAGMPNYPDGTTWFFNPLAWQFIFVLGAFVFSMRAQAGRWAGNRYVLACSIAMLGASFIAAAPWTQIPAWSSYHLLPKDFVTEYDKRNLAFLRIAHFVAVAVVAYRLLPPSAAFWKSTVANRIALCGRHSLPVYCAGVLAAIAVDIYRDTLHPGLGAIVAIEIFGLVLLLLLAVGLDRAQRILRRANAPI
ncbi:MAG: OpgC domain-containing protein [Alphaproteobacteria bacterium]|nr:OpgC domain-containing protein [Alphaproteobacteria bacterium]